MSWVRLDDQFADHPKIAAAGPLASWLYVCGLIYCARYGTDGFIPQGQLRKLADLDNPQKLADKLTSCGLWDVTGDGRGYRVHDYLDYNPSAKQVAEKKQKVSQERSKAGANGAEIKWQNHGKPDGKTMANESQTDSKTDDEDGGNFMAPSPSPSPSPLPDKESTADCITTPPAQKPRDFLEGFDELWDLYGHKVSKDKALKAYGRLRPSPELREKIRSGIIRTHQTDQWRRGIRPHFSTWLNEKRWNDELTPAVTQALPFARNGAYQPTGTLAEQKAAMRAMLEE